MAPASMRTTIFGNFTVSVYLFTMQAKVIKYRNIKGHKNKKGTGSKPHTLLFYILLVFILRPIDLLLPKGRENLYLLFYRQPLSQEGLPFPSISPPNGIPTDVLRIFSLNRRRK